MCPDPQNNDSTGNTQSDITSSSLNTTSSAASLVQVHPTISISTSLNLATVSTSTSALHQQALAVTSTVFTPTRDSCSTNGLHTIIDVTDYSILHMFTAITAYVLKIVDCAKENFQSGPLTTKELQQAKLRWIKDCQYQVFSKEVANYTASHLHPNVYHW